MSSRKFSSAGNECGCLEVGFSAQSDENVFEPSKESTRLKAKLLGEEGIISERWMPVEGKMRAVNRNVRFNQRSDARVARSGQGLKSAPEHAMVNDEEVRIVRHCSIDGAS
jgi:hypothetical protein